MTHHVRRLIRCIGLPCPYCDRAMIGHPDTKSKTRPTRDHINPQANGGGPCIIVCSRCNHDKAHYSLVEWVKILLSKNDPRAHIILKLGEDITNKKLKVIWDRDGTQLYNYPLGIAPYHDQED